MAHALLGRGLEPGSRVLLFCENSVEAYLAKIGIANVSSLRVEAVLYDHPGVLRAAVVGLPHEHWGEAVTAVVVLRDGSPATEEDIVEHCRARLGGYETPKAVIFTGALPETVGDGVLKYKLLKQYGDLFGE